MNNRAKSNLDIEYQPYAELEISNSSSNLAVLIKHDYYSSNTEHGKTLLAQYLSTLIESSKSISAVYLIDSGVKLLSSSNPLRDDILLLAEHFNCPIIICNDSIDEYCIDYFDSPMCETLSASSFFYELTLINNLIIIE